MTKTGRTVLVALLSAVSVVGVAEAREAHGGPTIGDSEGKRSLADDWIPAPPVVMSGGTVLSAHEDPPPSWLTYEMAGAVGRAARKGLAYDPRTGAEVALAPLSIHPSSEMVAPSGCTMGFVFGSPGSYQMATAGHCVDNGVGTAVTIRDRHGNLATIGTVSAFNYNPSASGPPGEDWGLVSISSAFDEFVDPSIPVLRGPQCGVYEGHESPVRQALRVYEPFPVRYINHQGKITGEDEMGRPRDGVILPAHPFSLSYPKAVGHTGFGWPGDSGLPVLVLTGPASGQKGCTFGQALAIHTAGTDGFGIQLGTPIHSFPHPPLAEDRRSPLGTGLSVSVDGPDRAYVGEVLEYTITVRSTTDATGVTYSGAFPGVTWGGVEADSDAGACAPTPISPGTGVTCRFGTLEAGETVTVLISATPQEMGPHTQTASVTADGPDENPTDDHSAFTTIAVRRR